MGVYSEYLNTLRGFPAIKKERKKQLHRIAKSRKRAVLTIAADLGGRPEKANAPIMLDYTDLLPVA